MQEAVDYIRKSFSQASHLRLSPNVSLLGNLPCIALRCTCFFRVLPDYAPHRSRIDILRSFLPRRTDEDVHWGQTHNYNRRSPHLPIPTHPDSSHGDIPSIFLPVLPESPGSSHQKLSEAHILHHLHGHNVLLHTDILRDCNLSLRRNRSSPSQLRQEPSCEAPVPSTYQMPAMPPCG